MFYGLSSKSTGAVKPGRVLEISDFRFFDDETKDGCNRAEYDADDPYSGIASGCIKAKSAE